MTENVTETKRTLTRGALAAAAAQATVALAAEKEDQFLSGIKSDDEDARYEAWAMADSNPRSP